MKLAELAARCEAGEVSRELDLAIWWYASGAREQSDDDIIARFDADLAAGADYAFGPRWRTQNVNWLPTYTTSLDAAMSLLGEPERPFVTIIQTDFGGLRRAGVYGIVGHREIYIEDVDADTLPLAVCAAALGAIKALKESGL